MLFQFVVTILALSLPTVRAAGTETLIGVVGKDFVMLGADQSVARSIVLTSTEVDKIKVISNRIVMAAAGELADVDDIYGNLKGKVVMSELEAGVRSNVEYLDLGSGSLSAVPESWSLLSVSAVAKLARNEVAQRLRSRAPYQGLGLLIAGMQKEEAGHNIPKTLWRSVGTTSFADEVRKQLKVSSSSSPSEDIEESQDDLNLRPCLFWIDEYGSLQKIQYGIHGMGAGFGLAVLDQGFRENLKRKEAAELIQNCYDQLRTRYLINSPKAPLIKCVDATGCYVYDG